ncbi:phage portal protein [Paenibacillus filicis]|uniref:Phage portal protein n=1 Tax=Paenibacillus gyeongsangnamensis TaxID=3388067 RepID=A0ABT4Q6A8_9BACL|nr:phage portal protein [Paenibacillus filicis]MCZ8512412.1 phage portal protein [Paenibacillus filicis]
MSAALGRKPELQAANQEPAQRSNPFPFFFGMVGGVNRPQPNFTIDNNKLRSFSESPIPRRAIDYIKNQVSMLDWDIVAKNNKSLNARQKKDIERIKRILESPNHDDSWRSFIEQIVEDMLVIGHTNIEKREWKGNTDQPFVLYPFDAASLQIYTNWNGSRTNPRYAQINFNDKSQVDFRDDQLIFIRHNPRTNSPWGLSPLKVAADTINHLLNAQAYAGKKASNATTDKALNLGEDFDQPQLDEFIMRWRSEIEGRGVLPIFASKGATSIDLGASSDEALFLKWQGFLINQIANAFGLDSQKFGAVLASRATGDILDNASDEGAIRPLAHSVAAAINKKIIEPLGIKDLLFKFRWTANLQDEKSLSAILQIDVQQDIITIDEARERKGLQPLPDGKGIYTRAEYLALYGRSNNNNTTFPAGLLQDENKDGMNDGFANPKLQIEKSMNQTADPLKVE